MVAKVPQRRPDLRVRQPPVRAGPASTTPSSPSWPQGQGIKVGNGFEAGVNQGPLIDDQAIGKVERHVADAVSKGARGGGRQRIGERFTRPRCWPTSRRHAVREGRNLRPGGAGVPLQDRGQAIAMANATEFGLASYFYSRDIGRIFRVGEALEYGMVGINTGLISTAEVPFGGVKQSGLGREGAKPGIGRLRRDQVPLPGRHPEVRARRSMAPCRSAGHGVV